jgi:hypothetical protein
MRHWPEMSMNACSNQGLEKPVSWFITSAAARDKGLVHSFPRFLWESACYALRSEIRGIDSSEPGASAAAGRRPSRSGRNFVQVPTGLYSLVHGSRPGQPTCTLGAHGSALADATQFLSGSGFGGKPINLLVLRVSRMSVDLLEAGLQPAQLGAQAQDQSLVSADSGPGS